MSKEQGMKKNTYLGTTRSRVGCALRLEHWERVGFGLNSSSLSDCW